MRPSETGRIVQRRRPLTFVDVGAFLAQKLDHFLSPEGRSPVEERLPDVVHVVDGGGAVFDGLDQGVGIFAADAVDQLSVSFLAGAVNAAKSGQTTARCRSSDT